MWDLWTSNIRGESKKKKEKTLLYSYRATCKHTETPCLSSEATLPLRLELQAVETSTADNKMDTEWNRRLWFAATPPETGAYTCSTTLHPSATTAALTALPQPHTDTWWLHRGTTTWLSCPRGATSSGRHSLRKRLSHRCVAFTVRFEMETGSAVLVFAFPRTATADAACDKKRRQCVTHSTDRSRRFQDSQFIEQQIVKREHWGFFLFLFFQLHCQQCLEQPCHSPHISINTPLATQRLCRWTVGRGSLF